MSVYNQTLDQNALTCWTCTRLRASEDLRTSDGGGGGGDARTLPNWSDQDIKGSKRFCW
jgi:hypothetical protein